MAAVYLAGDITLLTFNELYAMQVGKLAQGGANLRCSGAAFLVAGREVAPKTASFVALSSFFTCLVKFLELMSICQFKKTSTCSNDERIEQKHPLRVGQRALS